MRYLIISIAYTANMTIILKITFYLRSELILDYFGGDPEGSIGMVFIPSIYGYYVLGAIYALVATIDRNSKSRHSGSNMGV